MSRSKQKSPFFKTNLIKNNKKWIKILKKNLIILPEYVNYIFNIYNGKIFIKIKVNQEMVGYKFGEFINTKKRCIFKKNKK